VRGILLTTLYTADHECSDRRATSATIGVTDYAQSQTRDVVFVELPKVGRSLKKRKRRRGSNPSKPHRRYAPISGR